VCHLGFRLGSGYSDPGCVVYLRSHTLGRRTAESSRAPEWNRLSAVGHNEVSAAA